MLITIILEIIIIVVLAFAGYSFWQLIKRGQFLKATLANQCNFEDIITLDRLHGLISANPLYLQKTELGYSIIIASLIESDKSSQHRMLFIFGIISSLLLWVSYYLGEVYFIINSGVLILLYLIPISSSAQVNAFQYILTLAAIIYKWRKEDIKSCDKWIEMAWSLKNIYTAVQNAK